VSRTAWTAVSAATVALGVVAGLIALVVGGGGDGSGTPATTPSSSTQPFSLPLAQDSSALALGKHTGNVLVGLAARTGGPVEVAAVRAETPLSADELRFALDGESVETQPCGDGCSRIDEPVLDGSPSELTVRAGSAQVSFRLPARLPPSGEALFARALKAMDDLRAYRFSETLTSGLGGVASEYEVQAPDRLSLRTGDFRSVIIGRKRWDYHDGRWQSGPFPGLNVADVLMWHRAKHARVVGHGPNGVTRLAAFGLEPVPAWFRLTVEPSGRVLEAEMTASSHFMTHRYRGFNRRIEIKPPK
jgi:hypothetical protein